MIDQSKRIASVLLWSTLLVGLPAMRTHAAFAQQTKQEDDPATADLRRNALDLYRHGKFVDAMPLLEQLATGNPQDFVVKEHWAYCILEYSATLKDPEARRKARLQARSIALDAQRLGDQSDLLQILLAIPPDGSETKFSERADVDTAMKAAEANYARGDLEKAREGYQHVLELDPKNYDATVFVGDVYFKQRSYNSANEWFGRAVQLNPDRETAYRYWADSLAMAGKNDQAREKYIQAVIAEPYTRAAWVALRQWSDRIKQPFNGIILQNKSSVKGEGSNSTVTIDEHSLEPGGPETAGWIAYSGTRLAWKQEKFKKEFPKEATYRRTMREEAEALDTMVKVLAPEAASEKKAQKIDPALLELIRIDQEGLLEPFVFLNRADPEIAQDYPAYRAEQRAKLIRYMDEFVLPKTAAKPAR